MSKTDRTQIALDRLGAMKSTPLGEGEVAELKKFLKHRSNYVVGKACDVVSARKAESFTHDLESAFERFMLDPVKTDPGCTAKLAVVKCLTSLDHCATGIYLSGVRHVQPEGAALALGESRLPEAFQFLRAAWEAAPFESHRQGLALPMALLRSEDSFAFLVNGIHTAPPETAADIVGALVIYASDDAKKSIVAKVVDERQEHEISEAFKEHFRER